MFEVGLGHYLTLGAVIFTIGVVGIFLNRKNIIVILMSIELILLNWSNFYFVYTNCCSSRSSYWLSNYCSLL